MPGLKRDKLLSDLERERLEGRGSETNRHTRNTNDVRVKRKLAAWLKGLDDVQLILDRLPKEDIQDTVSDFTTFKLMVTALGMIEVKGYHPIIGDVEYPENWQVLTKNEWWLNESPKEPAGDIDIVRSVELTVLASRLDKFLNADDNPVNTATKYMISWENPQVEAFLKDYPEIRTQYLKAVKRIAEAAENIGSSSGKTRHAHIFSRRGMDLLTKEEPE